MNDIKYIPISAGLSCTTRFILDELLKATKSENKTTDYPFMPFDWCVTGDIGDIFKAIKKNFENYYELTYVGNAQKNDVDYNIIRDLNQKGGFCQAVYKLHNKYPSIIEYHYDLDDKMTQEKIQRRIKRFMDVIIDTIPILFIRIINTEDKKKYSFFYNSYEDELAKCKKFINNINSLNSKNTGKFKILLIYIQHFQKKNVKNEFINEKTIEAHNIYTNKYIDGYRNLNVLKYVLPIIKKYNFYSDI